MAFQFKDLSILIVDDDPSIREITSAVLRRLELKSIESASNGETAFELFKKHDFSLILTDWQMDLVDGIELTQIIRNKENGEKKCRVPIILTTGHGRYDIVEKARDAGVTELLVKPYSADDLIKRIVYVLNRPRRFVENGDYFGPDRRRIDKKDFQGPEKRKGDRTND